MITVISGTNRPDSRTLIFARRYLTLLESLSVDCQLLDLAEIPLSHFVREMYDEAQMSAELKDIQERYILGAEKFVFFVPEYNGSYPGVLKLLLDGVSVNEYSRNFKGKFTALVGIASGRAGNLRGMDHLAASLSHMGSWVLPNRLPISSIENLLTANELHDKKTISALETQAKQLIAA